MRSYLAVIGIVARISALGLVHLHADHSLLSAEQYKIPQHSNGASCSKMQSDEAEKSVDTLKDWEAIYSSFRRYRACDDGAVAEGYSDAVAVQLANRWQATSRLVGLTSIDRAFREFVLRHIDTLMSPKQANEIYRNATKHCPATARSLCTQIVAQLRAFK
jgi:hypothetical protein